MKSVMQHAFGKIQVKNQNRSLFDYSHGHKTAFDAGYLVPVMVTDVLPGETVSCDVSYFGRLATLLYPIMDNVHMDTFHFFCPSRLLWSKWERFIGALDEPDAWDTPTEYIMPVIAGDPTEFTLGSIYDHMGLPINVEISAEDNPQALPLRMYNKVYNEWFRDQNLQDKVLENTDDGPDDPSDYNLLRRGKRHDYFTSVLPLPQKGDDVVLPLGTSAPVIGNGLTIGLTEGINLFGLASSNSPFGELQATTGNYGDVQGTVHQAAPVGNKSLGLTPDGDNSGMIADLTEASAITVNAMREAIAYQQVLEMDARGGSRYTEHLEVTWGVKTQDFRLQRSEYLGGSTERIMVSSVAQTSASPGTPTAKDVQAGLSAYGITATRSGFHKTFPEHGYIMTLVNVRADLTYQQGMRRMWSRQTRFDFPHPALMHLGEQAVLNKEIFFTDGNTVVNNTVFGYQERYSENRYFPSEVTGIFRSDAAGSLDVWHLSQDFPSVPVLNANFIVDDPPIDRVIAVPSQPHILLDCFFNMKSAKAMPMYGTPGLNRF